MSEDNFKGLVTYERASPLNIKNLYFCPFLKGLKTNEKVLQWFLDKTAHLISDDNISTKLINLVKRYVVSLCDGVCGEVFYVCVCVGGGGGEWV